MSDSPSQSVFDMPHYQRLTESRERFLRRVLPALCEQLVLRSALDAGCGVGFFSSLLQSMGLDVVAFDGRQDNVAEARRRYAGVEFRQADVEDPRLVEWGRFDLVLCFGLLYHLENPFRAIRNLQALADKVLLIESMTIPEERPFLALRDEGSSEDQGLRWIAFYPSEACLAKMLYRSGFPLVARFSELPDHPDFHATLVRRRVRSFLLAAKVPVKLPFLEELVEPQTELDPWTTPFAAVQEQAERLAGFVRMPWREKLAALRRRLPLVHP
jgi:SAM-dependent methyltransferase